MSKAISDTRVKLRTFAESDVAVGGGANVDATCFGKGVRAADSARVFVHRKALNGCSVKSAFDLSLDDRIVRQKLSLILDAAVGSYRRRTRGRGYDGQSYRVKSFSVRGHCKLSERGWGSFLVCCLLAKHLHVL